jgi:RimJ/RimL family protein N-acetyltransferase
VERTVTLVDGYPVVIRDMRPEDAQRSFDFFASLPEEDRRYLRVDVRRWELVERRISDVGTGRAERLVVLDGDRVVADGSLELEGHGWGDNIGEIRLIVARDFQRRGLGTLLARELYYLAAEHKVDRIVSRMMAPQKGARNIMKRLGFQDEFVIPNHVRDREGIWQDMILMRCNLTELWREMEGLLEQSDMRWHR